MQFAFEADDAYKMLKSIDIENEMCTLVEKGVVESEERRWKNRHGLDKDGRRKKNSLYVVDEDVIDAKEASLMRLEMVNKSKNRMKDMKKTKQQVSCVLNGRVTK